MKREIRGELMRQQVLFSVVAMSMVYCLSKTEKFPFDPAVSTLSALALVVYTIVFVSFPVLRRHLQFTGLFLSVFAITLLGFIVSYSGGIVSPFIFLYFAILISESIYGFHSSFSIFLAPLSYLSVIWGEYFGLIHQKNIFALGIYSNFYTTLLISLFTAMFMIVIPYAASLIYADLSSLVKKELDEKEKLVKRFLELNAMAEIGSFTHRIAHDIRGMIFTIKSHFQMSEPKTPEEREENEAMLATVSRIGELVQEINNYGKPAKEIKEKVNLKDFLSSMVRMARLIKGGERVNFTETYGISKAEISALKSDLQKVFFNILKNAVEAVENEEKPSVKVQLEAGTERIVILVSDNGCGISPEIREKIFREPVTTKEGGTGVGMSIIKEAAERNGGEIEISDNEECGKGTVVKVYFQGIV